MHSNCTIVITNVIIIIQRQKAKANANKLQDQEKYGHVKGRHGPSSAKHRHVKSNKVNIANDYSHNTPPSTNHQAQTITSQGQPPSQYILASP